MPDEVILEVTTIEENVTVETTAGDVVEIQVIAPTGSAATVSVGTTTTLAPGSSATVVNAGTSSAAVFNFGIPTGATGAAGASGGSTTAWRYRAKTNATSGYPTNGHLLWNNATQTSATEILVSHLDDEGTDIELLLSFFAQGQKIFIQNRDDSSQNQIWEITGTPTVTGANTSTAYYTFPVTLVSSAGAAFTNNHSILFGSIAAAVNAVTSATTSNGTANLAVASLQVYPSGSITLASTNSGGVVILSGQAATDARSIAFPNASGTLALTSQLPTLGTNVATFLATPSSANLAAAVTDETGSGLLVFATSPSLTTPTIAGLTLSGLVTHSGSYSQTGGANFNVEVTTAANLTATGSGTVTVGGAGGTTISGSAAFTSTTRPTSAGTGTPAATSLMTRDDVALEPFYNLGSIFRVSATPAFATSGTGSAASQLAGDRWIALSSGTANSGWARAQFGRGITTPPGLSGAGINFASKLGVSIILWLGNSVATDNLNIFRLRFGSDNTPVADGVDAVSYRGFGVEIKARGSTHDWRVYGHNGTSITYSAWSNTGLTTNTLQSRIYLSAMSNGAGSITASIGINGSRTLGTITTTGGPTTAGTSTQAFVECHVANSASGTSTLSAALYDAIFYAQI